MENKILDYCTRLSKNDTEHIEQAKENKWLIEQGRYRELNGCPSAFGLDDYIGLCEVEEVEQSEQFNQCEQCWKKALEVD